MINYLQNLNKHMFTCRRRRSLFPTMLECWDQPHNNVLKLVNIFTS